MEYTDEQEDAARSRAARTLIRALAGTGKTETVAHRAASLTDEGAQPGSVLCFTRSARAQLSSRLNEQGVPIEVETVHGSAYRVVRGWFEDRGLTMPRVTDGADTARKVVRSAGFAGSGSEVDAVLRASTGRWNGTVALGSIPGTMTPADVRALADLYSAAKRRHQRMDFDDLVVLGAEVAEPVHGEVIVDEAQDLSAVQVAYVEALATHGAMTWVGDPHQAVFGFAGVDGGLFDRLDGWSEHTLTRSFRSAQEVLDAANQLIGPDRLSSTKTGGSVTVRAVDFAAQADEVVARMTPGTVVLTRTRDSGSLQSERLEGGGWVVRQDPMEVPGDRSVDVSTVHSAKGSEWDHVVIVDTARDGFNGFEPTPEERRLFYVAMTRACRSVTVYSADGTMPWEVQL